MRTPLLLLALAIFIPGCSIFHHNKTKSVSHIYSGDSPSIHMQPTESAGGPLNTYWDVVRISRKAEYALRALVAMARKRKSWQIQELSAQENIPIKFLEQILLALRHGGLLASKRGVGGGYSLRKSASEISVGEVIRILDGPLALVPCAVVPPGEPCTCPNPLTCPLRLLMTDIRRDLAAMLDGRTIEDMLKLSPAAAELTFEI
jgi:Rrf2 family protein